jgi:hypothetical protein
MGHLMLADSNEAPRTSRVRGVLTLLFAGMAVCTPIVLGLRANSLAERSLALQCFVADLGGKVELECIAPQWLPSRVREADVFLRATEVHLGSFPNFSACTDAAIEEYWSQFREQPPAYHPRAARDVGNVPTLRAVFLDWYSIGDDDLAQLASLRHVEVLTIARTKCTNEGLKHLRNWGRLTQLRCSSLPIDDEAVPHLQRLRTLRHLDVSHTRISHTGVAQLALLPELRRLRIIGLGLSPETVQELRRRFPHLIIDEENVFGHEEDWEWSESAPSGFIINLLLRPESKSHVAEHAKKGLGVGGQGCGGRLLDQASLEVECV